MFRNSILFCILSLVVIASSCGSGPQIKYHFEDVRKIGEMTGTFAFPDYRNGIVYFDNGTSRNGKMNVNFSDNQVYFQENEGETSTFVKYNFEKNKGDVSYAVIDSKVFTHFSKDILYRLAETGSGVCLDASVLPVKDGETQTYSYNVSLFLSKDGKVLPFSTRNLLKFFPKSKSSINALCKDGDISFQAVVDSFCHFE